MAIRQAIEKELTAWAAARQAMTVAQRLLDEDPENKARRAQLERATIETRETTAFLRAALHARGYSIDQLQQELRVG